MGRRILEANNRRGTFDNLGDTEEGIREILDASFERVEMDTVGSMAIFAAMNRATRITDRALAGAVLATGSEKAAVHHLGLSHSTVKHHLANAGSK